MVHLLRVALVALAIASASAKHHISQRTAKALLAAAEAQVHASNVATDESKAEGMAAAVIASANGNETVIAGYEDCALCAACADEYAEAHPSAAAEAVTDVEDASTGSTDTIEDDASQALAQAVTDDSALTGLSYGDSGSYGSGSGSGSYAIAAEEDADGFVMEVAAVAEKDPKMTKELAQSIQQGYIFAKKMGFNISADESAVAAKAAASKNVTPSSCEDGCTKCMAAEKDGTINIQGAMDTAEAAAPATTTASMMVIEPHNRSAAAMVWLSGSMLLVGATILVGIKLQQRTARQGYAPVPDFGGV